MTRATFEGPVLSGDNRFGPLRNVGYTQLNQYCDIDLTNSTVATPLYAGSSGQFVNGNLIPNSNAVVYTPSSSVYPSVAQTIPADTSTNIYRGVAFYLPIGCDIDDILVDCGVAPAISGGTSTFTSATF